MKPVLQKMKSTKRSKLQSSSSNFLLMNDQAIRRRVTVMKILQTRRKAIQCWADICLKRGISRHCQHFVSGNRANSFKKWVPTRFSYFLLFISIKPQGHHPHLVEDSLEPPTLSSDLFLVL